jgi:hypothetical protein
VPRKLWPKGRSPNPAGRPAGGISDVPSVRRLIAEFWDSNPAFVRRCVRQAFERDTVRMLSLYARVNGELAPALADVLADNLTSVNITWALPVMPKPMLDSPIDSSESSPRFNSSRGSDAPSDSGPGIASSDAKRGNDARGTERAALAWKMPHEMRSSETAM